MNRYPPWETVVKKESIGLKYVACAVARNLLLLSCYVAVAASTVAAIAEENEERMTFEANSQ